MGTECSRGEDATGGDRGVKRDVRSDKQGLHLPSIVTKGSVKVKDKLLSEVSTMLITNKSIIPQNRVKPTQAKQAPRASSL